MAIQVEAGSGGDPYPKVPAFWNASGRIYQLLPGDAVFVHPNSVIEDPDTGHIGIDTDDGVPDMDDVQIGKYGHVGLLRVVLAEHKIDGFIVDLRYITRLLLRRSLGFLDDGWGIDPQIREINKANRAVPALGVLFMDPLTREQAFPCRAGQAELLVPFRDALTEFVDKERKLRGGMVVGEQPVTPAATLNTVSSVENP